MDGGCGCGQVRYTINAPQKPVVYACHCTDCQTQSGSAFALHMPIFDAVLSLSGDLISGERTMPSGAVGTIFSCANCLVRIYSKNSTRPGMAIIRAGTLDNSSALVPKFHLWVSSRQGWFDIPGMALTLEQQPESIEEWTRLLMPESA